MRIALKCAYDGSLFHGYARQPNIRTVEGDIISALKKTGIINNMRTAMFRSASRTDKGVSSFGNVFSLNTELNSDEVLCLLADDLSDVIPFAIASVDESFYPRHAQSRWYRYFFPVTTADLDAMRSIADVFTGTHDFSNFARVESHRNPVRTIDKIEIKEEPGLYCIDFFAQTYLWHQIRRIIAAIQKVLQEKIVLEDIKKALSYPEKQVDFGVAPSDFLILMEITYPNAQFKIDPDLKHKEKELEQRLIARFKDRSF
jgi:tRNA pseudouridine38-40 synthase